MEIKQGTDLSAGNITNTCLNNRGIQFEIMGIAEWHYSKDLIDGSTAEKQIEKSFEELIEVYAAIHANTSPDVMVAQIHNMIDRLHADGRIKQCDGSGLVDGVGDTIVTLVNQLERVGVTMRDCLAGVLDIISKRKGEKRNGTFVKEEDL